MRQETQDSMVHQEQQVPQVKTERQETQAPQDPAVNQEYQEQEENPVFQENQDQEVPEVPPGSAGPQDRQERPGHRDLQDLWEKEEIVDNLDCWVCPVKLDPQDQEEHAVTRVQEAHLEGMVLRVKLVCQERKVNQASQVRQVTLRPHAAPLENEVLLEKSVPPEKPDPEVIPEIQAVLEREAPRVIQVPPDPQEKQESPAPGEILVLVDFRES